MCRAMKIKIFWYALPKFIVEAHDFSFMSEKMYRLSVLQIFVYNFIMWSDIFVCFQNCSKKKVKVKVESIFSRYNFCNLSA